MKIKDIIRGLTSAPRTPWGGIAVIAVGVLLFLLGIGKGSLLDGASGAGIVFVVLGILTVIIWWDCYYDGPKRPPQEYDDRLPMHCVTSDPGRWYVSSDGVVTSWLPYVARAPTPAPAATAEPQPDTSKAPATTATANGRPDIPSAPAPRRTVDPKRWYRRFFRAVAIALAFWMASRFLIPAFDLPHPHIYGRWRAHPTIQWYSSRRCLLCGHEQIGLASEIAPQR